jgi:hypothetical protein
MEDIPGVINVVQAGARLDPGYVFPTHVMNHPHNILHIEGTTSYEYVDGGGESYTAGQVGDMDVARPGTMANRGTTSSAYVMTWLQTPGTALSSPFTAPAEVTQTAIRPPSTGDAGLLASRRPGPGTELRLLLIGSGVLVMVLAPSRTVRRSTARGSRS